MDYPFLKKIRAVNLDKMLGIHKPKLVQARRLKTNTNVCY